MDTNEIFKYRSVTACMKASYESTSNNFKSLVKKTWWASLILAIFTALTLYFRMPNKGLHDWGMENPWSSYIIQTLIYLAFLASNVIVSIAVWNWFNGKGFRANSVRFTGPYLLYILLLFALWYFFPSFIMGFVDGYVAKVTVAGESPTTLYCIKGALGIITLILGFIVILPAAYILPRQMIREKGEPLQMWKSFKCGLRHSGSIFKMGFLGSLILLILMSITSVPCMLLGGAQTFSQLGALNGDPLGVPSYFTLLYLVVLIITCFLYIYISIPFALSFAYLYGAIETQEKEKRERLESEKIVESEAVSGLKSSYTT